MTMLHSINDAAKILAVGRTTLYRLINDGELDALHIGHRTLVPDSSITALIERKLQERRAA